MRTRPSPHGPPSGKNVRFRNWIWLILLASPIQLFGVPLETSVARRFSSDYSTNEARLAVIDQALNRLPVPYTREPTGTGGFISDPKRKPHQEVRIKFKWPQPVALDAIALFPLRLFMDEVYGENLYWPEHIVLEATKDGEVIPLSEHVGSPSKTNLSLPEFFSFPSIVTDNLRIRCVDLPKHPHQNWYAAGFSEICIFSGSDNVAPRATVTTNGSRDGYHVLSAGYLTDSHTPLGLPQERSTGSEHGFLRICRRGGLANLLPYTIKLAYSEPVLIDAIRIDPAIQHAYGKGFPVRFTIQLIDAEEQVVQHDDAYASFPLRNPGLNPYIAHFPETLTSTVRISVLELSQPVPQAPQSLSLSEITLLHRGEALPTPNRIEERMKNRNTRIDPAGAPPQNSFAQALLTVCNGHTQTGRILSIRAWCEQLNHRRLLLEEQHHLAVAQSRILTTTRIMLTRGGVGLVFLGLAAAALLVARGKRRSARELKLARADIASNLHDDVGSNLGAIVLHVEKLEQTNQGPEEQQRLHSILRLTRESVFGLREVLNTTAPEIGRSQDLVAYFQELAGLLLGKTSCTFETAPGLNEQIPNDATLRKELLLFFKEALYNAKNHADCSQVTISLKREPTLLVLCIKDNGKGVDSETLAKPKTLRTLKQRAEKLQGTFNVRSTLGQGTALSLEIPVVSLPAKSEKRRRGGKAPESP